MLGLASGWGGGSRSLQRSAQSRQCRKPRLMPRPSGQKGSCSASPTWLVLGLGLGLGLGKGLCSSWG